MQRGKCHLLLAGMGDELPPTKFESVGQDRAESKRAV
jgi:hypothetical protein